MRNRTRSAIPWALLVVGLMLVQVLFAADKAQVDGKARPVDYRMTPLEQVKKVNSHLRDRAGAGETMTVMAWDGVGDGRHLIVDPSQATTAELRERLSSGSFDSVSWHRRARRPLGSCDSTDDCEKKIDEMCRDAGHNGVDRDTVQVITHVDGSKTCSGDCTSNGAIAFVTCNPQR
jgi:hypothetical protein